MNMKSIFIAAATFAGAQMASANPIRDLDFARTDIHAGNDVSYSRTHTVPALLAEKMVEVKFDVKNITPALQKAGFKVGDHGTLKICVDNYADMDPAKDKSRTPSIGNDMVLKIGRGDVRTKSSTIMVSDGATRDQFTAVLSPDDVFTSAGPLAKFKPSVTFTADDQSNEKPGAKIKSDSLMAVLGVLRKNDRLDSDNYFRDYALNIMMTGKDGAAEPMGVEIREVSVTEGLCGEPPRRGFLAGIFGGRPPSVNPPVNPPVVNPPVHSVPEAGTTALMLVTGLAAAALLRRRLEP